MKKNPRKPTRYIILTYPNRVLEWLCLRKLYSECLKDVLFVWKYHNDLTTVLYKPALVFRDFEFLQLLNPNISYLCQKSKRFARYLDPRTQDETSSFASAQVHIRTVDTNIIHHKGLRQAVAMGLNHVSLKPTSKLDVSVATTIDGFL
jgi:hypothetical protein